VIPPAYAATCCAQAAQYCRPRKIVRQAPQKGRAQYSHFPPASLPGCTLHSVKTASFL
jgi:hypothetical protein